MLKVSVLLMGYCAAEGLKIVLVEAISGKLPRNRVVGKFCKKNIFRKASSYDSVTE